MPAQPTHIASPTRIIPNVEVIENGGSSLLEVSDHQNELAPLPVIRRDDTSDHHDNDDRMTTHLPAEEGAREHDEEDAPCPLIRVDPVFDEEEEDEADIERISCLLEEDAGDTFEGKGGYHHDSEDRDDHPFSMIVQDRGENNDEIVAEGLVGKQEVAAVAAKSGGSEGCKNDKAFLLGEDRDDERWELWFQALLKYKTLHGHCNVPRSYEMPHDFINLDDLKKSNSEADKAYTDTHAMMSSSPVSSSAVKTSKHVDSFGGAGVGRWLGRWLQCQRQKKRLGSLREDRQRRLQELVSGGCLDWYDTVDGRKARKLRRTSTSGVFTAPSLSKKIEGGNDPIPGSMVSTAVTPDCHNSSDTIVAAGGGGENYKIRGVGGSKNKHQESLKSALLANNGTTLKTKKDGVVNNAASPGFRLGEQQYCNTRTPALENDVSSIAVGKNKKKSTPTTHGGSSRHLAASATMTSMLKNDTAPQSLFKEKCRPSPAARSVSEDYDRRQQGAAPRRAGASASIGTHKEASGRLPTTSAAALYQNRLMMRMQHPLLPPPPSPQQMMAMMMMMQQWPLYAEHQNSFMAPVPACPGVFFRGLPPPLRAASCAAASNSDGFSVSVDGFSSGGFYGYDESMSMPSMSSKCTSSEDNRFFAGQSPYYSPFIAAAGGLNAAPAPPSSPCRQLPPPEKVAGAHAVDEGKKCCISPPTDDVAPTIMKPSFSAMIPRRSLCDSSSLFPSPLSPSEQLEVDIAADRICQLRPVDFSSHPLRSRCLSLCSSFTSDEDTDLISSISGSRPRSYTIEERERHEEEEEKEGIDRGMTRVAQEDLSSDYGLFCSIDDSSSCEQENENIFIVPDTSLLSVPLLPKLKRSFSCSSDGSCDVIAAAAAEQQQQKKIRSPSASVRGAAAARALADRVTAADDEADSFSVESPAAAAAIDCDYDHSNKAKSSSLITSFLRPTSTKNAKSSCDSPLWCHGISAASVGGKSCHSCRSADSIIARTTSFPSHCYHLASIPGSPLQTPGDAAEDSSRSGTSSLSSFTVSSTTDTTADTQDTSKTTICATAANSPSVPSSLSASPSVPSSLSASWTSLSVSSATSAFDDCDRKKGMLCKSNNHCHSSSLSLPALFPAPASSAPWDNLKMLSAIAASTTTSPPPLSPPPLSPHPKRKWHPGNTDEPL